MDLAPHVADGSGTDILRTNADVRFVPKADIQWRVRHVSIDRCGLSIASIIHSASKSLVSVAQKAHIRSTVQVILCGYGDNDSGDSMSRTHRTAGVHDDAIIAFLLFCLEIYQAEQIRKRKLH